MRCPHCGYHNSEDNHRCMHCGRRFGQGGGSAFAAGAPRGAKPSGPQTAPLPGGTRRPGGRRRGRGRGTVFPPAGGPPPSAGQLPQPRNPRPQTAPLLPSRTAAAETPRAGPRAAWFRLRFLACLLDGMLIAAAAGVFVATLDAFRARLPAAAPEINLETAAAAFFILLCFYWLLFIYFAGRTQGMRWTGLEIATLDGEEPTESQRLMRVLGMIVSLATFGIGFAWALVDERKLTFHDNMSKTMIVESEP